MTGTKYLALGYPWRDASLDDLNQRVRAPMMPYIGRFAPAQKYEQLGFADYSHVLFEFDPREVYGLDGPREPSNPEGMSGGGLFRLDSLMGFADAKNPLVAILIENRGRTHGVMVATRLALVYEAIRAEYPDLSDCIRRSRRVRVNVRSSGVRRPE